MGDDTDLGGSADDEETRAFLEIARAAVRQVDPSPPEVTELAKLAYEFRDVEIVDFVDTSELTGVRSSGTTTELQAVRGDTSVIWTVAADLLSGVVHAVTDVHLSVQTPVDTVAIEVDGEDGSFEAVSPRGAYRLIIKNSGDTWVTPWTS